MMSFFTAEGDGRYPRHGEEAKFFRASWRVANRVECTTLANSSAATAAKPPPLRTNRVRHGRGRRRPQNRHAEACMDQRITYLDFCRAHRIVPEREHSTVECGF